MTRDLAVQAAALGALADPVRRRLYEHVAAQPGWVGREQAATDLGIALHTAKFHLDRLADEGLLEVDFRRLGRRSGRGAGRPAKLYRRSRRQWEVTLPVRHYDVVGRILANGADEAITSGRPVQETLDEAARAEATTVVGATEVATSSEDELDRLSGVLAESGYEPYREGDAVILANCPFDALARSNTALVCGLNRTFVQGIADGLGCSGVEAHLEPHEGRCCVAGRRRG